MREAPIVIVRDLVKTFAARGASLRAVDGVSFDVGQGETLGLVGESGSGKSTTGRILVGLEAATSGSIRLFDQEISPASGKAALRAVRRRLQFVFQDPQNSLNPRMRAQDAIAEPLDVAGGLSRAARNDRVRELLEMVGLPRSCGDRFPHEFSGGQRQRIGIARALALKPEFIVCDEPVSSLDVSMQAQIVNLLLDLQERLGLSYLFIAHDLAVVRSISARVAVMYAGSIVEIAPRHELYTSPRHPYTQALLAAIPRVKPNKARAAVVTGELPSQIDTVPGCTFHPRCPFAFERCRAEKPKLREIAPSHLAACHLHDVPA
ncbi:oligopeptide/dipeptide ABC transporter, ATP-binding protein [Bradyrhizobium sp. YR681]|uniref:ABC transporter ATP-binding protein n=1 Tax=Bradyrhizobium sp. YR681 TaxID=1144344 RepID=UPI00027105D7|nr:ABC transporter ATP-binding protein [Bradyrhizobium sp. YR681]EJN11271.1 oligopeptide/dipeptide ABC transporter, ATP-binding protein [Bradyrhizobium sp. YR681]